MDKQEKVFIIFMFALNLIRLAAFVSVTFTGYRHCLLAILYK